MVWYHSICYLVKYHVGIRRHVVSNLDSANDDMNKIPCVCLVVSVCLGSMEIVMEVNSFDAFSRLTMK